ncbi:pyrroline-5-carboxylate reductase [Pseudomonas sp. M5]|uniref:pyrroline-5-carboxylate reductase family protein n=1 Tax=Pseudomonas sp. M5 TaxID=1620788 RepID=UPI0019589499|nr:pyrroline-5-carboxylate reductase [Pseudomonas sp. M5]MBM7395512.1 pyrroline-5-carboxylate reductase [Pseudomonas sp. M5]HDS1758837.1 pyrroline-5-carboxylate reductase [Pseudomonas putida]
MKNIYMVGAGHMGGAILLGLKDYFKSTANLRVVETDTQRMSYWREQGFDVSTQIQTLAPQDCVVLAVPPQQFESALAGNPMLSRHRGPVVSVMAGITHARLVRLLGHDSVVRAIPNTPSEVAQGVTMYYAPSDASTGLIDNARQIFDVIGISLRVKEEWQIDTGTALAGGGPALVAHFVDALQDYGLRTGLDIEQAAVVALQLLSGTAALIRASGKPANQICREVQTAGGTTERAIGALDAAGFKGLVNTALDAAARRSAELGE